MHAVAEHRRHAVEPLSTALADMRDRQQSYDALRRRASFALDPTDTLGPRSVPVAVTASALLE